LRNHDVQEQRILAHLERGQTVTQRALSQDLGIALGLTNLLIARLVKKGWVRVSRVQRSRIRYLITPAGIAAKTRLVRAYVRDSVRFYRETRDRIREELSHVTVGIEGNGDRIPIAFYGAGEIAEIAYVCLQDTPLELTAMVDPERSTPFFTAPVYRPAELNGNSVAGRPFHRLIVMAVDNEDEVRAILSERGVPPDAVFWV
jgi:DNA-binding MarR family transcriptional regulator